MSEEKTPADLLVDLVKAASALVQEAGWGLSSLFSGPRTDLVNALEALDEALEAEAREMGTPEAGHWHPGTWAEVRDGARVRVGGQHEATVTTALPLTSVGSGATQVRVVLEGMNGGKPYTMPPSGPVEVWRPALPEWAAQAYLTLAETFGEEPYVEGLSRG